MSPRSRNHRLGICLLGGMQITVVSGCVAPEVALLHRVPPRVLVAPQKPIKVKCLAVYDIDLPETGNRNVDLTDVLVMLLHQSLSIDLVDRRTIKEILDTKYVVWPSEQETLQGKGDKDETQLLTQKRKEWMWELAKKDSDLWKADALLVGRLVNSYVTQKTESGPIKIPVRQLNFRLVETATGRILWATAVAASLDVREEDLVEKFVERFKEALR